MWQMHIFALHCSDAGQQASLRAAQPLNPSRSHGPSRTQIRINLEVTVDSDDGLGQFSGPGAPPLPVHRRARAPSQAGQRQESGIHTGMQHPSRTLTLAGRRAPCPGL